MKVFANFADLYASQVVSYSFIPVFNASVVVKENGKQTTLQMTDLLPYLKQKGARSKNEILLYNFLAISSDYGKLQQAEQLLNRNLYPHQGIEQFVNSVMKNTVKNSTAYYWMFGQLFGYNNTEMMSLLRKYLDIPAEKYRKLKSNQAIPIYQSKKNQSRQQLKTQKQQTQSRQKAVVQKQIPQTQPQQINPAVKPQEQPQQLITQPPKQDEPPKQQMLFD